MKEKKCCVIGFDFKESKEVYKKLKEFFLWFIEREKVFTFLFSESGKFSYVCYQILSELKEENKEIKRVYCYQESMLFSDLCKFKQLSSGLYEDFICVLPFSYDLKDKYYINFRAIEESDIVIFPETKDDKVLNLFEEYSKLCGKTIEKVIFL